ncbi:hypothetical protein GN244_ATG19206 [Phytophthora infestans]|uniref:RxLR effector protein n=1 Tax=Phytophthora infestans TaxID=4787 RepID=A0A833VUD1_PHYIN|nr:hypothetical protein GN244_ATG19206 [Phytophthora infestans]KAF4134283.1 hypothetical protein GN958_ATG16528 [Phytophthora infestans]
MRFHYVVLLAAAALFVCSDPVSGETDSKRSPFRSSLTVQSNDASKLTKMTTLNEDGEERTLSLKSISGFQALKKMSPVENLKKISSLFKSKITPGT